LARLKPTCRLVNTCRGAVLDEAALAEALADKVIAGAAIDVFSEEPLSPDHPLCHTPNTVLTPHIAGMTQASMLRTSTMVAQGVIDILEGRRAEHVVNAVGV
jgi:phosphoglycerate dehydrogenase-like enzyme